MLTIQRNKPLKIFRRIKSVVMIFPSKSLIYSMMARDFGGI
jgi:hypothetical protein